MGGETTIGNGTVKRIFVLTDSDLLFNIIKANLQQPKLRLGLHNPFSGAQPVETKANLVQTACGDHQGDPFSEVDLIIVAHSAHTSEPVVTLAQAHLANQIGQIPILIISDRPFEARPIQQIYHLDFPFDSAKLRQTVEDLLTR
jgi:hypothetical protein